jgi:GNAT superfamily N-acetyltransferase
MITYHVENFTEVVEELKPFFPQHWEEIALNKDRIKLSIDWPKYEEAANNGVLFIATLRNDSILIGYFIAFLAYHMHYKDDLFAFTDIYYVAPEFRKGRTGIKLFQFVEQELKKLGVVKMTTATKLHADVGNIFKYLGWKEVERTFTKCL